MNRNISVREDKKDRLNKNNLLTVTNVSEVLDSFLTKPP